MNESNLKIELNPNYVSIKKQAGSMQEEKLIPYDGLRNLFQQDVGFDSGLLPGEYGVQRIVVRDNKKYVLYLEPARIVSVRHEGNSTRPDRDDFYDSDDDFDEDSYDEAMEEWHRKNNENGQTYRFPSPILCFMVRMNEKNARENRIELYALKSPILTGEERIYRAPFGNIFDHGGICWGGSNSIVLPTVKAIQGLSTFFFNAPSNMDLDGGRFSRYQRKYLPGEATRPLHFHMDMDLMLKDENETPESALEFVNSKLITHGSSTLMRQFENFIRNR